MPLWNWTAEDSRRDGGGPYNAWRDFVLVVEKLPIIETLIFGGWVVGNRFDAAVWLVPLLDKKFSQRREGERPLREKGDLNLLQRERSTLRPTTNCGQKITIDQPEFVLYLKITYLLWERQHRKDSMSTYTIQIIRWYRQRHVLPESVTSARQRSSRRSTEQRWSGFKWSGALVLEALRPQWGAARWRMGVMRKI